MKSEDRELASAFHTLEEQYNRPLSDGERDKIINNLSTFFSILNEWDMKQQAERSKGDEETKKTPTD